MTFAVPQRSLPFWHERFAASGVQFEAVEEHFNQQCLPFTDPDGMRLNWYPGGHELGRDDVAAAQQWLTKWRKRSEGQTA